MFSYYVVCIFDGEVFGTDDTDKAEDFAFDDDYVVICPKKNEHLLDDGKRKQIGPSNR